MGIVINILKHMQQNQDNIFGFCQKSQGVKFLKNYRACHVQAIIVRGQLQFVSNLG